MKALAGAVLFLAVGCTPAGPPDATPSPAPATPFATAAPSAPSTAPVAAAGEIFQTSSDVARSPAEAATDEELAELVAADRAFAFDLYRELAASEEGDLFLSPYSISTALSMVLAGARGATADELASALHVGPDAEAWHVARNRLELELAALADHELPGNPDAVPLTLEPTNAIFGQAGYPFNQPFLDTLGANYGAPMHALDFSREPEPSRVAINEWVAQRTRDRIPELIPPNRIDSDTVAVLVNAIYFLANWIMQFNPGDTRSQAFHLLDGSTVEVDMMSGDEKWQYAQGDGWQAIELPYVGLTSMLVLVPEGGRYSEIEAELDSAFLAEIEDGLSEHQVDLQLPRWESKTELNLVPTLQSLGVERLFSLGEADLTGIADAALFVDFVIHAANVTVDEKGTEAAAATAVGVRDSAAPLATLTVDRPFIYLIRDDANGEILFLGRLLQP